MALSMYQASVPVYIKMLNGLANCLKKGAAHYTEHKLDEGSLLSYRLFPDMFTFAKQVQEATNHARNVVRLAGQEPPKVEENEKSLAELIARVEKTMEFMNTLKPAQINGTEDKVVTLFDGFDELLHLRRVQNTQRAARQLAARQKVHRRELRCLDDFLQRVLPQEVVGQPN